ncbi:hypothetical protein SBF1_4920005 [Candidatus Desulfosporosinus infrequens]|uniref:Uncharacterized protein n=1 Tax=Candidatus Desulfosporosinus infrequens TaxID=2043169 RepID=A0A2U3LG94_9FIRM|nr:hypothetical protein SBF1_4920005 [Candidatus Desulfosporosinus infrequens]
MPDRLDGLVWLFYLGLFHLALIGNSGGLPFKYIEYSDYYCYNNLSHSSSSSFKEGSHRLRWWGPFFFAIFGNNFMRISDSLGELNDAPSERVSIAVETIDEVKHAFSVCRKKRR